MNSVTLMGRLTREPEMRTTQSGTSVVSFSIAVERFKRKGKESEVDFIDIVAWAGTAEFVQKYFEKGQRIAVTGRLEIRSWNDKDGNSRKSAQVVADKVYFADTKKTA